MSICIDFHILMPIVDISFGLFLSGFSMSIYYVACIHVAQKSSSVICIDCISI